MSEQPQARSRIPALFQCARRPLSYPTRIATMRVETARFQLAGQPSQARSAPHVPDISTTGGIHETPFSCFTCALRLALGGRLHLGSSPGAVAGLPRRDSSRETGLRLRHQAILRRQAGPRGVCVPASELRQAEPGMQGRDGEAAAEAACRSASRPAMSFRSAPERSAPAPSGESVRTRS